MTDADAEPHRPTGAAWPPALRHALGIPESGVCTRKDDDDKMFSSNSNATMTMMSNASSSQSDTSFTTSQLRQYIHRGYAALSSLQRQLHRGEESYFEESYAHGNLFSGWDNIWIEAGVPTASSGENNSGSSAAADGHAVSMGPQKSAPSRKMPNDHRWFSASCHVAPRGDAKVAAILARESLLEPPPSSGGVLNGISPAKGSQVDAKLDSSAVQRSASTKSEPANKKVKLDGGVMFEPTSVAAKEILSSKQHNDPSKPSTSLAPLSSANLDLSGAILSAELNGSINLAHEPMHMPTQEVMPSSAVSSSAFAASSQQTKVMLSSSTENDAGAEIKSTNQSMACARGEVIDSTCDMEVDCIVHSAANVIASGELSSATKFPAPSAAPSLSPSTVIASSINAQTNASVDTRNIAISEAPSDHLQSFDPITSPENNISSTNSLRSLGQEPSATLSNEPSFKAPDHELSVASTTLSPSPKCVDESKGNISNLDKNALLSEQEKLRGYVTPPMGKECEMSQSKEESRLSDSSACVDLEGRVNSNHMKVDLSQYDPSVENSSQPCNRQQDPSQQAEEMESRALGDKPHVEGKNQTISSEQPGTTQPVGKSPASSEKVWKEENCCTNKTPKTSAAASPPTPETAANSKARTSDNENAANSTPDSDSDEDQTLSQIVQLKVKSTSKEAASPVKESTSETKSHAGKKTRLRRRVASLQKR